MRFHRRPDPGSYGTRTSDALHARRHVESATDVALNLDRTLDADEGTTTSEISAATAHQAIRRRTSQLPVLSKFLYRT